MATSERDLTLEARLNNATNPARHEEDWEAINSFCDQVNAELEGPQYAVRLLAHKCQSPMENEALFALSTLEACVKSCGKRFHQEIGKFRFLNEIIKVISPKYLGTKTSEKVKKRCIELIYCWQKGLPHEPKVLDAYKMLKQQGLVKEDPVHMDKVSDVIPKLVPEEEKRATFEDEEKSKLLAKLLKSKSPDDLQAANRLIKNMVKQDTERMEKVSRRINELETIHTNVKLLSEMVTQFNPKSTTSSEKEMMKELCESLEKLRPKLFRLASDTDEKDTEGLNTILKANDEVSAVMSQYKKTVEGLQENGQGPQKGGNSLLDLDLHFDPASTEITQNSTQSSTILDDEMLSLGLKSPGPTGDTKDNLLSDLDDLFSAPNTLQDQSAPVNQQTSQHIPMMNQTAFCQPAFSQPAFGKSQPMMGFKQGVNQPVISSQGMSQPIMNNPALNQPISYNPALTQPVANSFTKPVSPQTLPTLNQDLTVPSPLSDQISQGQAMQDLDVLGQTLMQQTLGDTTQKYSFNTGPKPIPAKVTLNQMASQPKGTPVLNTTSSSISNASALSGGIMASHPPPLSTVSGSSSTTVTSTIKLAEVIQSLTDIFVPLETIQPSASTPVNAYDKNGLKIVIHTGKDRPREDVLVMVVSVVSTNTTPVKGLVFQAAVPKIMKVKLQPPSATDLPAFNPILPPAAITQVMLVANPQKTEKVSPRTVNHTENQYWNKTNQIIAVTMYFQEKIRLKFKVTYTLNEQSVSDVGDIDSFTVQ